MALETNLLAETLDDTTLDTIASGHLPTRIEIVDKAFSDDYRNDDQAWSATLLHDPKTDLWLVLTHDNWSDGLDAYPSEYEAGISFDGWVRHYTDTAL